MEAESGLRRTDSGGGIGEKTAIIEDGILRNFIYDNYWARLDGKESAGNA